MNKIIYVAHPMGGDIKGNTEKVKSILLDINRTCPDITPMAHYLLECEILDDSIQLDRSIGMVNNRTLLESGAISELWLFGDRISNGMKTEIGIGIKNGISIIPKTDKICKLLNDAFVRSCL